MININFDEMLNMAAPDRRFTYKQLMQWHYFSKYGLVAQWNTMCHAINGYVDQGALPSGWILAYGSLNDYYYRKIVKLSMRKAVKGIDAWVTLDGMRKAIDNGYERLIEETEN